MNFLRIAFLLILLSGGSSYGQDTLLLLTGKVLTGTIIEEGNGYVVYYTVSGNDTSRTLIENERIFSITKAGEEERVLYRQDETIGNVFTKEELRYFIYGEQDADRNYRAKSTFVVGIISGAVCGWFIDEAFPWVLAGPFVYTGLNLIPLITINRKYVRSPDMLSHETYVMGYVRVARNKKVQSALKGSISGLVIGSLGALLLKPHL